MSSSPDHETANDPRSRPIHEYFHEMGAKQRDALEKIFERTIDASCLPSCENQLEQQLDVLMFFDQDESMYNVDAEPGVGAYAAPRSCEYCGASNTTLCPTSCQRPKLFFRKQRPPFSSPEGWDPVTEYELPPPAAENDEEFLKQEPQPRSSSWVSGLFGGKAAS